MRTINEVCETYKAVFEGKKVLLNGYELTSDGVNWIVNNTPIDTIANKKKDLSLLLDKIKGLKEFAKKVGISDTLIDSTYYLLHDSIDDMIMLVYNDEQDLNIIYNELHYVYIEQIAKQSGDMNFTKFDEDKSTLQQTTHYKLSNQSIELINRLSEQPNFKFSQNHFYKILPEGIQDFSELINSNTKIGLESEIIK